MEKTKIMKIVIDDRVFYIKKSELEIMEKFHKEYWTDKIFTITKNK